MTERKLYIHTASLGEGVGAILRCSNVSTIATAVQREDQISVLSKNFVPL